MSRAHQFYTAEGFAGARTIDQIAALAGCSIPNAYLRVREGRPVAGKVWQKQIDAPHGRARKLMVCDDFPGRTFTQDEVRAMGKLKSNCPLQPYVRNRYQIGGHVWRFAGEAVTRSPGQDNVAPPPVACSWRKNGKPAPAPHPSPEPRGAWRFGTDPEAMDIFPTRERQPVLDSGAIGGRGEM